MELGTISFGDSKILIPEAFGLKIHKIKPKPNGICYIKPKILC